MKQNFTLAEIKEALYRCPIKQIPEPLSSNQPQSYPRLINIVDVDMLLFQLTGINEHNNSSGRVQING